MHRGYKRKREEQDRKVNSRMGIAGVWQKSRDILPQIFSLSPPFSISTANSKEKEKVDVTQLVTTNLKKRFS